MTELEDALREFSALQLAKFQKRAPKWGADSVTIDGNLARMSLAQIELHYNEEVSERLLCRGESNAYYAAEDVDVANLAFLSWFYHSHHSGRSR